MKVKTSRPTPASRHGRNKDRHKTLDTALFVLFIISLGLTVWGINMYRRTIIEPKYLFVAVSIGTIIAAVILLFVTREFLNAFWTLFIAAAIGGGSSYFAVLYVNRELADKEITSELFDIQKTGNLAKGKNSSCRSPYAIIDFYGHEKELIFYCDYEKTIHQYKKVRVDYLMGFLGFPVVQNQVLVQ